MNNLIKFNCLSSKIHQLIKSAAYCSEATKIVKLNIENSSSENKPNVKYTPRMEEFKKRLREKTPIGKLDELPVGKHPFQEEEPLEPWPNNTNPNTGETGGPAGPEPTRYGDWERKGRVSDF